MNYTNTRQRKLPRQQRGATALGMLTIVAILGLGLYAVIRLVPVYLEYYEVVRSMQSVAKEMPASDTNPGQLRNGLGRHWEIEDIKSIDPKEIEIRKVGSTFEMTAEYRVEKPFIGNVSLLASFYKTVTVN